MRENLTLGNRKSDFLKKLKEVLYNRRKFVYSSSDYLYEVFWCCKWNKKIKKQSRLEYRNQIYRNGIKRFTHETDIVEVVKSIRMLKTLSKIVLSKNQKWLLGLEDSNLLTNNTLKNKESNEINVAQNINNDFHENIFGQRKSIIGPNLTAATIDIPLSHEHLPSYLSQEPDLDFRMKVDNLISNFAEEKVTAQNMKILKLAYGFIEEDEVTKEQEKSKDFVLKTEESNNALFESNSKDLEFLN